MTRTELWELVWSTSILKASAMVGLSTAGLAKACRRNGVAVPPRGYRQRVDAGQDLERAPPPDDGGVETGVQLLTSASPIAVDATAAMLQRRLAASPSNTAAARAAFDVATRECRRILDLGLRQQLRDAAEIYLSAIAEAAPTLDEITADVAGEWLRSARVALSDAGPAAGAVDALRTRSAEPSTPGGWLRLVLGARSAASPTAIARAPHRSVKPKARPVPS